MLPPSVELEGMVSFWAVAKAASAAMVKSCEYMLKQKAGYYDSGRKGVMGGSKKQNGEKKESWVA